MIEFGTFNGTFIDAKIKTIQLTTGTERVWRQTTMKQWMNESFGQFEEIKRGETKE